MKYELECRKCKNKEIESYYNENKKQFQETMQHIQTNNTNSYCNICKQNTVKELIAFNFSVEQVFQRPATGDDIVN